MGAPGEVSPDELRGHWQAAFANTRRGIAVVDPATGIMRSVNPAFVRMHGGASERDYVGRPLTSVFCPVDAQRVPELAERAHREGFLRYESDHVRADGSLFPVLAEVAAAYDDDGRLLFRVGYFEDETERRALQAERDEAAERFERAFADAPIGMALVGLDGRWLRVNTALLDMLGYREQELLTKTFQDITHPDDLDADEAQVVRLVAGEITEYDMEKRYFSAQGHLIWVLLSVSLVRAEDGTPRYFVAQIVDITERKRIEENLHRLADHDPLTGLWNRRRFEDEVERQAARCRRYGERAALLLFDLDEFKYVNDSFGHKVGDDLLVHVARTATDRLRLTDGVARLGGDEFGVLLSSTAPEAAYRVGEEVCRMLHEHPLTVGGEPVHSTVSLGITSLEEHASAQEAFVAADIALYDAKHRGRNRVAVYDASDGQRERITSGLRWSQRLRHALAEDAFVLHAQPIVELATGDVVMHELLIRALDDAGRLVYPDAFLYHAERFGYIRQLDRWVLERAVHLAAAHPQRTVAVNLSASSVTDATLADDIERRIAAAGCAPRQLVFEVTETQAIAAIEQGRRLVRRLRRLGCRVALDDFGSGFASLHHLKALAVDLVKIDGDFVRDLVTDPDDRHVVAAIQQLATGMGKDVVAEHVEDDACRRLLAELGVRYGQGHHLGAPAPVAESLAR